MHDVYVSGIFARSATPKATAKNVAVAYPSTPTSMAGTTSDLHPFVAAIAAAILHGRNLKLKAKPDSH